MTTPQSETAFTVDLLQRLRQSPKIAHGAYYLDLRSREFGDGGRVILHCPTDAGWPKKGRTTHDPREAKRWVTQRYGSYYYRKLEIAKVGVEPDQLVRAACMKYLEDTTRALGANHNTVKNRASQISQHIIPSFGHLPFAMLDSAVVRPYLNALQVQKPDGNGQIVTETAAIGTKRNLRTTLLAIWRHVCPDVEPPFAGIRLDSSDDHKLRRERIAAGDVDALLSPSSGAMDPAKLRRILLAACWYDETVIAKRPTMRAVCMPNTAIIIALLVGTGMRIGELLNLRWWMVKMDEGYILVPGTKSSGSLRVVPLQEKLLPWLELLQAMESKAWGGRIPAEVHVIRTDPCELRKMASRRAVMNRVSQVLRLAGLKPQRKATHWARATHATWGSIATDLVSTEALKAYLGHSSRYGGATDDYISTLIGLMPEAHRRYITHLPSPEELSPEVPDFTPAELPHWTERGGQRAPKSPEAAARRQEKQDARLRELRAREAAA